MLLNDQRKDLMWLLWLLSIVNIGLFAPVGNVVSLVMGQLIILIYPF